MRSIMFTGVRGAGKSTLVGQLAASLGLPHLDYSDYMLEVIASNDKAALEQLTPTQRRDVIDRVEGLLKERRIFSSDDSSLLLFVNHLTVSIDGVIHLPIREKYRQFNMAGLCVLHAAPEEILLRRAKDQKKRRLVEDRDFIVAQQEENRSQAALIAQLFAVPLIQLFNENNRLPVREAEEWIRQLQ
jgi:adenylate kinase